jgi:hypothetical protein
MLRRQSPIRNVNLTLLPIDRIVLILKAELFLWTTGVLQYGHESYTVVQDPGKTARGAALRFLQRFEPHELQRTAVQFEFGDFRQNPELA